MRFSTLLSLSSLLLLSLSSVVLSGSLPAVPSEYQTTVEFNFGTLGYTLAYDESYSQQLGLLRTDGRYGGRGVIEFTTYTASSTTMRAINTSASDPCAAYALTSAQNASLLYAPTYALWQLMNYSGFTWSNLGQDQIGDRETNSTHYQSGTYTLTSDDIFCDAAGNCDSSVYPTPPWDLLEMVDMSHGYDPSSYSVTFQLDAYLDVLNVTGGAQVGLPMRIEVSGSRVNLSSGSNAAVPFNVTYDFANFRRLDRSTLTSLRRAYSSCVPSATATAFRAPFPSSSTVSSTWPALGSAPPLSSFPNEFTMVVEAPMQSIANAAAGPTPPGAPGQTNQNWAMRWTLDEANLQESVQFIPPWSSSISVNIWQYGDASAYPTSGQVWTVGEAFTPTGPSNVTCSTANLTNWGPNANSNLLRQSLAMTVGSFADFFVNQSGFDATSLGYVGKSTVRSVYADVYQGSFTGQGGFGNLLVSWTTTVYLFPAGWQYPGRTAATDLQLPLLIVNNGSVTGPRSFSFRETYNVFSLEPQTDANFFTDLPSAYNCPMTVSQYNNGTNNGPRPTPPVRTVNLPWINPEYSATVEINFGTLGYTLSYDEWYSQSQGLLRADGRYDSRAVSEVTNFATSPVTMSAYNQLTGTCSSYSLTSAQNASLLYTPAFAVLQLMNYSGLQWLQRGTGLGQANIPAMIADRNIPATEYWIPKVTINADGSFCDALGNCNNANGDITDVPLYSFSELLDFATSNEANAEDGITDEPTYTTVLELHYFLQTMPRGGVTGAIPLRVELNGTRYMTGASGDGGTSFYNIYDFTNWRSLDSGAFTAITASSKYSACVATGAAYRAVFPNTTAVEVSTIAVGSAPSASSFPSQFVMQVEGLVAEFNLRGGMPGGGGQQGGGGGMGPNIGNNTGSPPVNYAARWSYDSVGNQESVSTYADNFTLALNPTVYIYEYGSSYSNGGEVWQVDGSSSTGYTCVDQTLSDSVENPLESERGGVISFTKLFTDSSYDISNFQYVGRSLQRGVYADWYRASFSNVAATDTAYYGNLMFTYTANLYMYPKGWAFPGRANAGDLQLPFRVTFQGMQRNLTANTNTSFLDAYNIFLFSPAADILAASSSGSTLVSSAWFTDTPAAYSCPAYTSSSTSSSSSGLSRGAIAGIIIAVLVALVVVLVMWAVCRRMGGGSLMKKASYGSETVTVAGAGGSKWKAHKDEDGEEPSVSQASEQEMV